MGEELTAAVLTARTRGLVHLERDRLAEAEAEFLRLMELVPDEAAGPANLALVALRRGDIDEAERRARQAVERGPDDPWIRLILARALELGGDEAGARAERERALELDPGNLRAMWALAGGPSGGDDASPGAPARIDLLSRIVERAGANLPARLELAEARLDRDEPEAAAAQLEEVRALVSRLPAGAEVALDRALDAARAGDADGARDALTGLHGAMRLTAAYHVGLQDLAGPRGEATGFPDLAFSHELSLDVRDPEDVLAALRFSDATEFSGIEPVREDAPGPEEQQGEGRGTVVALGDVDGDRAQDVFRWSRGAGDAGGGRLLRNDLGRFVDWTPDVLRGVTDVRAATFTDYDGDGLPDLYVVRDGPNRLFRNGGDGRLEDVSEDAGVADGGEGRDAVFADLDHDGDLDLLLVNRDATRVFRNRGDGGFVGVADAMGLNGEGRLRDVAFADFDGDADLDLVAAAGTRGVVWFENLRQDRFRAAVVVGSEVPDADAVAVGDWDNDGRPDLAVAVRGAPPRLLRNRGDGDFERSPADDGVLAAMGDSVAGVAFLDYDNDGRLDLALAGPGGVVLLRNGGAGAFEDRSDHLPSDLPPAWRLVAFDYNQDGDSDLLADTGAGVRLLRNDGGNANHHFDLRLVARGAGSGKVNRFGIGSKVEVRAGDLYQSRTVRGPVTRFGLGSRLKADVVRIVWTNGVPQYIYYPGTDEELLEDQRLKGSCAFVYTWDGEGYTFVTDAVWGSALGMPLGLMGVGTAAAGRLYAPAGASREYLRIPGEQLRPRDGRYRLQVTEELWEVAYLDELKLLAVDHPDTVEVFVDEKFTEPGPAELRLYRIAERILPVSATDGEGNDLMPALAARDGRYVDDLRAGRYQGVVEPHSLVLELPVRVARAPSPFLFLQGWLFPTDASINVAVSQSDEVAVRLPRLEVPDGEGGWRTAIPDMGYPKGKAKTVVVDLEGVVPPDDPRVRIRTNARIYWDHAFFAAGSVEGDVVTPGAGVAARPGPGGGMQVRLLEATGADLHYRGFSREYRKGGRHGPHWFDYDDVSTESPWLPIPGRYTRYGDVLPLLEEPDDMYVTLAPGDEITLDFDAAGAGELPEGWTRTFLLYTDGWMKDADLNTARGGTLEPLPFHGQSRYPHGPGEAYPSDSLHRAYLERYQTRHVPAAVPGLRR